MSEEKYLDKETDSDALDCSCEEKVSAEVYEIQCKQKPLYRLLHNVIIVSGVKEFFEIVVLAFLNSPCLSEHETFFSTELVTIYKHMFPDGELFK